MAPPARAVVRWPQMASLTSKTTKDAKKKLVRGKGRRRATFIEAVPNEVGVRVDARDEGVQ